jgi:hypothetical protein
VGPEGAAAGALIGGSLGAAALSAAQTLGPAYAAELQKTPNDPEGAWNRAWRQAEISGAFAGASWAVFPARFFQGPVKQLVFQIFGAQPALAVGERVTRNVVEGRPATEGVGEAYGQGVVGTLTPGLGHSIVGSPLRTRVPAGDGGRPGPTSGEARGQAGSSEQSSPTAHPQRSAEEITRDIVQGKPAAEGLGDANGGEVRGSVAASEQSGSTTQFSRSTSGSNKRSKGRCVWDLPATLRGRILEKIFGHNLHPNHPTIDIWDPNTGAVTSLKSVDLESPSYQVNGKYVNALHTKLSRAVDELADFEGWRYADNYVPEDEVTSRTLTVIVPGLGTAEQRQVLRQMVEVGRQRGVIVRMEVYR